jgi:hypothetical protein
VWRHLWSGSTEPFEGGFHAFSDFVFGPVPSQGERLPVVVGGASPAALRRAGAFGDGYQATRATPEEFARRVPIIRAAAEAAGRPMPWLSARVPIAAERPDAGGPSLVDPESLRRQVRAYEEVGVADMALVFEATDPAKLSAAIERFDSEVVQAVAG